MEKKQIEKLETNAVIAILIVMVVILAVKYYAVAAPETTVCNNTKVKSPSINETIVELLKNFTIENLTIQGDCAYAYAVGKIETLQLRQVNATVIWCDNGTVFATIEAKIQR